MRRICILYLLSSILLNGCGTAVSSGTSTSLDSRDLVDMTNQMSTSIVADPAIQNAYATAGSLKVVVQPVINQMHAEILTTGANDAFNARIRALLSKHAPREFTWIMNRDAFYRLRKQELDVDPGPSPDAVNPEYALTATFTSLANENDQGRSDYYVCNYSLTSLKNRQVLWSKTYEVQKRAVKGFLD